jgi:uncharacterized Zn finger protein
MSGFRYYPPSRPRTVDGGLSVRSARGAIGESWWSKRFIAVLESFALGSRLTRGKNYARRGQVLSLDLVPGVVTAKVQGSRATPYRIAIGFAPFTDAQWQMITDHLAEQAIFTAQLLAGEVPHELEAVLAELKVPLFPSRFAQLRASCSCPDSAVPCKHLAATFYVLAERFDGDPFALLHWRGRSRDDLLARLRSLRTAEEPEAAESQTPQAQTPQVNTAPVGAEMAFQSAVDLNPELSPTSFWYSAPAPPLPAPTLAAPPVDLVLRQLGDPPAELGGKELTAFLTEVYRTVTAEPIHGS